MKGNDVQARMESHLNELRESSNRFELDVTRLQTELKEVRRSKAEYLGEMVDLRVQGLLLGEPASADLEVLVMQRSQEIGRLEGRLAEANATQANLIRDIAQTEKSLEDAQANVLLIRKGSRELQEILESLDIQAAQVQDYRSYLRELIFECHDKREKFERDSVFTHLAAKQYGTKDYRAGVFSRILDRYLAQRASFAVNQDRYVLLGLLEQHAKDDLEQHEYKLTTLKACEDQFLADLDARNNIPALTARLERLKKSLGATQAEIVQLFETEESYKESRDSTMIGIRSRVSNDFGRMGSGVVRRMLEASTNDRERQLVGAYLEQLLREEALNQRIESTLQAQVEVDSKIPRAKQMISAAREMGAFNGRRTYEPGFDLDVVMASYVNDSIELLTFQNHLRHNSEIELGRSGGQEEGARESSGSDDDTRRDSGDSYDSPSSSDGD